MNSTSRQSSQRINSGPFHVECPAHPTFHVKRPTNSGHGFTIVELMVATAIFLVLIGVLSTITSRISLIWQNSTELKTRQQAARLILERLCRDLEATILPLIPTDQQGLNMVKNPALDGINNPDSAFWQTAGASSDQGEVYETGYFLRWSQTAGAVHSELCRMQAPPTADDSIFVRPDAWLTQEKISRYSPDAGDRESIQGLLAENVIGLWIKLYAGSSPLPETYDSRASLERPTSAVVSIALMSGERFSRIHSPTEVTELYTRGGAEEFVNALPDSLKSGVQLFTARIEMKATR